MSVAPGAPPRPRPLLALDAALLAGYALLGAGLFGPAFTVTVRWGEFTDGLRSAGMLPAPRTLSIADSVGELARRGELLLFVVLGLTAFVVPILKLAVLQAEARRRRQGVAASRALAVAESIGRWAFTDVFAAALLVIRFEHVDAGPTMALEWGFYAYAAAATLTFAVSLLLRRRR